MSGFTGNEYLSDLAELVERHRTAVREDLEALPESALWERPVAGMTSAANLVLHLTGNLRHFIGHLLAGSGYLRDRDREFADGPGTSRERVLELWDEACVETRTALLALDPRILDRPAPVDTPPGGVPVHIYLLRLAAHLAYHAGQIHMLRRMSSSGSDA